MSRYLLAEKGKQLPGDYALEQIKQMLATQQLGASAHYFVTGMEAWAPLKQLLGGHPVTLDRVEVRRLAGVTTVWLHSEVAKVFP